MGTEANSILIPLSGGGASIYTQPEGLFNDVNEVVDVLYGEGAPLTVWLDVAKGYLASDR
jgi:hypothetical protein